MLDNFSGLNKLTEIEGGLKIGFSGSSGGGNLLLKTLSGLDSLKTVGGELSVYDNLLLQDFNGLQSLSSVGGDFMVNSNGSIQDFTGLENLTSINGEMQIAGNDYLTSLRGLDNIDPHSIEDLIIYYNQSLSDCVALSICKYISDPAGYITIHDNAEGCNTLEEVDLECDTVGIAELLPQQEIRLFPNPADDFIGIAIPDHDAFIDVVVFNISGQKILSLKSQYRYINVSHLGPGVYFVKIVTHENIYLKKFLKKP